MSLTGLLGLVPTVLAQVVIPQRVLGSTSGCICSQQVVQTLVPPSCPSEQYYPSGMGQACLKTIPVGNFLMDWGPWLIREYPWLIRSTPGIAIVRMHFSSSPGFSWFPWLPPPINFTQEDACLWNLASPSITWLPRSTTANPIQGPLEIPFQHLGTIISCYRRYSLLGLSTVESCCPPHCI